MVVLAIIVALAVFAALARRGWAPAVRAAASGRRVRPMMSAYVHASPATFIYLAILTVTTWVLLGSSHQVVDLLLREHSTSLHQLAIDPVRVLIRSAFWAPGYVFLIWTIAFAMVLAPAERWLGTRRCTLVFAAGHILATLGAAAGLWVAIHNDWVPRELANGTDIGVSYGFAAVAAVLTYRLPPPWRWRWATTVVSLGLLTLLARRTSTDVGHLLALGVGFASYPLTTSAIVRSGLAHPFWSITIAGSNGARSLVPDRD